MIPLQSGRRGRSRRRKHSKAQGLLRGHVGHIPHSDGEGGLPATKSTSSSTLDDGEAGNRTWIILDVNALWCHDAIEQ